VGEEQQQQQQQKQNKNKCIGAGDRSNNSRTILTISSKPPTSRDTTGI
jgi:hypothetical protein